MKKINNILLTCAFLVIFYFNSVSSIFLNDNFHDSRLHRFKSDDIERSKQLIDNGIRNYFSNDNTIMYRFYNPYTKQHSREKVSVWMYTSAIESVNWVLKSKNLLSKNKDEDYLKYESLLENLYANADYYLGTFTLTSFTKTDKWSVYAVDRVDEKGKARVTGIYNVYDDQMWLIRELLESYHLTKNPKYLVKAEYLTAYVLDGWDATRDSSGQENGGIPWGPGYVTKHACSNGPMISPLVWLYEIYKNKKDKIEYSYIDAKDKKTRRTKKVTKRDHYLNFAKIIYDWQKKNLLNSKGVYSDMMGNCQPNCDIVYEEINGVKYRAHTALLNPTGKSYTYNSGTMLSGAVDLYRVTKKINYLDDAKKLGDATFKFFAKRDAQVQNYYSFPTDGFNNWFNTVLLRGYVDLLPFDNSVAAYIAAYKHNLDYAYSNFHYEGMLPTDLLGGWNAENSKNDVEGMFIFSFASQLALVNHAQIIKHK